MSNLGTPSSIFNDSYVNYCTKTLNISDTTENYMSNKIFQGKQAFLRAHSNNAKEFLLGNLNSSFSPLPAFNELRHLLDQVFDNVDYDILVLLEDDMQLHPVLLGFLITKQTKCNTKTHSIKTEAINYIIAKKNSYAADFLTAMYLLIRKYRKESFGLVDGTPFHISDINNGADFAGYRNMYESFNFSDFVTKNGKTFPACENNRNALKVVLSTIGNDDIIRNLAYKINNPINEEEDIINMEPEDNINMEPEDNINMEPEEDSENIDFGIGDVNVEDLNEFDYEDDELFEDMQKRHLMEQEDFIKSHKEDWSILERKAKQISGLDNLQFSDVVDIMVKHLLKDTRGGRRNLRKI